MSHNYLETRVGVCGLILVLILLSPTAPSVSLSADPKDANKYMLVLTKPRTESGLIFLIDKEVLAQIAWSKPRNPRPKESESESRIFEIRETADGTLVKASPRTYNASGQTAKTLDYEGWYLTGDYSTTPPSVKLTKTIEQASYWRIPKNGAGPLVNLKNPRRPSHVVLGSTPVVFASKAEHADIEYRGLQLSFGKNEHTEFCFEKWERGAK